MGNVSYAKSSIPIATGWKVANPFTENCSRCDLQGSQQQHSSGSHPQRCRPRLWRSFQLWVGAKRFALNLNAVHYRVQDIAANSAPFVLGSFTNLFCFLFGAADEQSSSFCFHVLRAR
jgi:hypothetical protein